MLAGIWALAAFDYGFTVPACNHGLVTELNPVALRFLQLGPLALLAYKITLVSAGSMPLARFRDRRLTEVLTATVLLAYTFVTIRWKAIYDIYELIATMSPPGYKIHDSLI
jgi:hypothetical protein